jgi:predicted acylesterase/phospholipase RssA
MLKQYNNLVLSGGGVRGLYYLGFMKYFTNNLNDFKNLVGASIGSIFVVAIALGYSGEELYPYVINIINYSKIKSIDVFNFLDNFGVDDGIKLEHCIKKVIRNKINRKDITFKELYETYGKNVIITVICLESKEVIHLSKDNFPHMKIWKAVRMSMGIPFLFRPFLYKEKHYIDGGIKHNFPIDLYDSTDTLGIDVSIPPTGSGGMNFEFFVWSIVHLVTRHKRIINKQDVINLDSCYNPSKPLLPFQTYIEDNEIQEAIEYSYEKIKLYFENMESELTAKITEPQSNNIDIACESIVLENLDEVQSKHS